MQTKSDLLACLHMNCCLVHGLLIPLVKMSPVIFASNHLYEDKLNIVSLRMKVLLSSFLSQEEQKSPVD